VKILLTILIKEKKMNNKLSIYAISNGSREYYPDNTLSKFSVKLPFSFDLPISFNEKWGVAIKGIGLSSRFTSEYFHYRNMPLMIEIVGYSNHEICSDIPELYARDDCHIETNDQNEIIRIITGSQFYDDKQIKNINSSKHIIEQLDKWTDANIKHKAKLKHERGVAILSENSLRYNFFYNSLKDQDSLDRLAKNLEGNGLYVEKNVVMNLVFQTQLILKSIEYFLLDKTFMINLKLLKKFHMRYIIIRLKKHLITVPYFLITPVLI